MDKTFNCFFEVFFFCFLIKYSAGGALPNFAVDNFRGGAAHKLSSFTQITDRR